MRPIETEKFLDFCENRCEMTVQSVKVLVKFHRVVADIGFDGDQVKEILHRSAEIVR